MLVIPQTENDEIRNKGMMASTWIANPFWLEFQKFLHDQVQQALDMLADAKFADDRTKATRVDRWITIKELASRIERFPQGAIEAARELGDRDE